MFSKTFAVLALATGLAAAKPIARSDSAVSKRQSFGGVGLNGGFNGNDFDFVNGFDNFNNQQQVIQFQEENLQIIDNGFQQQVVQQAQNILIVQNENNGFRNNLNNVFRKSNFRNQFQEQTTVILVVQEIQVAIDNGFGGIFQQNVFAQSAIVANRGAFATQTIQIISQETLIAQNILGNDFRNFDRNAFIAGKQNDRNNRNKGFNIGGKQNVNIPTKTQNVQFFGARPTWSATASDPAATLGGFWANEIQDLQNVDNDVKDNELNNQIAAEEKKALDEQRKAEEEGQQQAEVQVEGSRNETSRKY
ncbi:hypothetical protein B0J11DRAFT_504811 [Dendryphion nanum]|uniref:Curlin associated repeat-containing protein n=1 Tax=Dendryphion nanum TaxID=256645 RepID=A0A9P9DXR3_9PLEO|nr:hypothetical protein B0J11DRAFT_504811 [Dendryphion nanum]